MVNGWGWAGDAATFLSLTREQWLRSLTEHHASLWGQGPVGSQVAAWRAEYETMTSALRECCRALPDEAPGWGIAFEYELPLEGGRRPDVVVLAGSTLFVLEFKSKALPQQADLDQVRGYVRDLVDYHAGSHDLAHQAILVLEGAAHGFAGEVDNVQLCASEQVGHYLYAAHTDGVIDLESWLDAAYHPLPTLVEAARRIFRDEPLPHVRRALAAGIPETVEALGRIVDEAAESAGRVMAFVTGVPGAGKTLVGLRLVYERSETHGRATFLSGNGPLVQVLQDALQSKVFVRDLHAFIKTHALNQRPRTPDEHVIVFDEAQRAWDADYMLEKKRVARSEPELLVDIGERIDTWAALVGLVGEGQEIHSGEEGGLRQWGEAARPPKASERWTVHCPPKIAGEFPGLEVQTHERLDLTVTLRSRRAEHLHHWVHLVLEGSISLAARQAVRIHADAYPVYVTRDLDEARRYVRERFDGEPSKRTGLLASSHAKSLPAHGVDNAYMATSRMNVARWYNAPPGQPDASNALTQPVTEFSCQGLELDLPIVCWGEDYRWSGELWNLKPIRRRYQQEDPEQLLRNTYRVLLTRGRDGMVIWIPPVPQLDATEIALLGAGVRPIPDAETIADEAAAV